MSDFVPRSGALRYVREDGSVIAANPGDAMYSTVTMVATEYYANDAWHPIMTEDDE